MSYLFHRLIITYCVCMIGFFVSGCGFKANPYYGNTSATKSFSDLEMIESKIE